MRPAEKEKGSAEELSTAETERNSVHASPSVSHFKANYSLYIVNKRNTVHYITFTNPSGFFFFH